ncbi:hypothetical protein ACFX2C_009406 [Malus domestica]
MNQNFSIKRWPNNLSLEEIKLDLIPFWIQMKGLPLNLTTEANDRRLAKEVGEFIELQDLEHAKGVGFKDRGISNLGLNFAMNTFKIFAIDAEESGTSTMNAFFPRVVVVMQATMIELGQRNLGISRRRATLERHRSTNPSKQEQLRNTSVILVRKQMPKGMCFRVWEETVGLQPLTKLLGKR